MDEAQNTKIVQEAYAAFGRGDIQALLAAMDEDISWEPIKGAAPSVPMAGTRKGKAGVADFFRILSEVNTFERFEPREFVSQGDKVVTLGRYRGGPKTSSKRFECDFVMVFTLRNGKVVHFEEFTDSAGINDVWATQAAQRGEAEPRRST